MRTSFPRSLAILALILGMPNHAAKSQLQGFNIYNEPVDISLDFQDFKNTYYLSGDMISFDPGSGTGRIIYNRHEYSTRQAFNNMLARLVPVPANEFPGNEYAASPELPFSLEFVSPRTIRLRASSGPLTGSAETSLMIVDGKVPVDRSWSYTRTEEGHEYAGEYGKVVISESPWRISVYDAGIITGPLHRCFHSPGSGGHLIIPGVFPPHLT